MLVVGTGGSALFFRRGSHLTEDTPSEIRAKQRGPVSLPPGSILIPPLVTIPRDVSPLSLGYYPIVLGAKMYYRRSVLCIEYV